MDTGSTGAGSFTPTVPFPQGCGMQPNLTAWGWVVGVPPLTARSATPTSTRWQTAARWHVEAEVAVRSRMAEASRSMAYSCNPCGEYLLQL